MKEFPHEIRFKYGWRKYQERVLDQLESCLSDRHLHIIAPPGSGKTILGLQVMLRLNKPTLILAPTIAIRNQWIQRFCELFLDIRKSPEWISTNIRVPGFLTIVTYQGLHAASGNQSIEEDDEDNNEYPEEDNNVKSENQNIDQIIEGLKIQGIGVIVVDEAHHLKNEWWHTLTEVKEKLDPVIVGLTATPPYDVTPNEWERYTQLNGATDMEISVPDLVAEGDLCPHQDYVHFTMPTHNEAHVIREFRENAKALYEDIIHDSVLVKAIQNHEVWLNPAQYMDWIYNHVSYYSSCLIFLNASQVTIPESHHEIIGTESIEIPPFDYKWLEILLDYYLRDEDKHFKEYSEHRKSLENKLKLIGAKEGRQISFSHNKKITRLLASSVSKLEAICEIVDFEYNQLGESLRLVILSDFIRKEFFDNRQSKHIELNRMGVIPIFEKLRRNNLSQKKIGVLTGSVIIIPKSALIPLEHQARLLGIDTIDYSVLQADEDYLLVQPAASVKQDMVHLITLIFQSGDIQILVGTKSLLGEGWDAPAINTLILASFVGSFVLSNQMRGRAIRIQKDNFLKTGNIWHLACLDTSSSDGGDDYQLMKRRFKSFVGITYKDQPMIENGFGRLDISEDYLSDPAKVELYNKEIYALAADRQSLKEKWERALESGVNLIEEIKIPFPPDRDYVKEKKLNYNKTIAFLAAELVVGLSTFGLDTLYDLAGSVGNMKSIQDFLYWLIIIGCLGFIYFGVKLYLALRLYIKYRDISKDIRNIGMALLNTLVKAKIIYSKRSDLNVRSSLDKTGTVYCHLEGGTAFEKSIFINTLKEIIGPVINPRYIILRKSKLLNLINQTDYHSVPEIIGRNKSTAAYFKTQWQKLVGSCELVFTRSVSGRKMILKSRLKSLASQFENQAEQVSKWL